MKNDLKLITSTTPISRGKLKHRTIPFQGRGRAPRVPPLDPPLRYKTLEELGAVRFSLYRVPFRIKK